MTRRLVVTFCPYPPNGSIPLDHAQCEELQRRIDTLPPHALADIKKAMCSVMGRFEKEPSVILHDAIQNLLCHVERDDVQYPLIENKVYIVSASVTGGNYLTDQIMALDLSGVTKEPLP